MMSGKSNLRRGAVVLAASAAVLAGSTLPAFASAPVLTKKHEPKRPVTAEQCLEGDGYVGLDKKCHGGAYPEHPISGV
jgi:hypothetical protein